MTAKEAKEQAITYNYNTLQKQTDKVEVEMKLLFKEIQGECNKGKYILKTTLGYPKNKKAVISELEKLGYKVKSLWWEDLFYDLGTMEISWE